MATMDVLLVEDDPRIARVVERALALLEVKLHAAAKASNRSRIEDLSGLVVTAFKDLVSF